MNKSSLMVKMAYFLFTGLVLTLCSLIFASTIITYCSKPNPGPLDELAAVGHEGSRGFPLPYIESSSNNEYCQLHEPGGISLKYFMIDVAAWSIISAVVYLPYKKIRNHKVAK